MVTIIAVRLQVTFTSRFVQEAPQPYGGSTLIPVLRIKDGETGTGLRGMCQGEPHLAKRKKGRGVGGWAHDLGVWVEDRHASMSRGLLLTILYVSRRRHMQVYMQFLGARGLTQGERGSPGRETGQS